MPNIKIGRETENQIVLPQGDDRTSRYHATLESNADGTYILRDHSANGTMVNGVKLHNSSLPIQRGANVMFAGVVRLDWAQVVENNKRVGAGGTRGLWWIALPVFILLAGGLTYWFLRGNTPKVQANYSKEQINDKYKKSVGLIFHSYFLRVRINNEPKPLYIGYNKQGSDFALMQSTTNLTPFILSGTGFLINSPQGNLITNRHVANPAWVANKKPDSMDPNVINFIKKMQDFIYTISKGTIRPSDYTFETKTDLLAFIPNGIPFEIQDDDKNEDLVNRARSAGIPTSGGYYHKNDNVDIAVLKVNGVSDTSRFHQINLQSEIEITPDSLNAGRDAVLLGYLGGLSSWDNIQKNFNLIPKPGTIGNPSMYNLPYDIQTEGGSSGSPVFNSHGKLIAVHYAGRSSGSAGYGILAKYIKDMSEGGNIIDLNKNEN